MLKEALPIVNFVNNSTAADSSGLNFIWDFGDGNTSTETNPTHNYSVADTFSVTLSAITEECVNTTSFNVPITPITLPNIFTPNGDGQNETFVIDGIEDLGTWQFELYNRWGRLVYEDESYTNDYNADSLRDGTYYYLITAPDESTCKGWVQITR